MAVRYETRQAEALRQALGFKLGSQKISQMLRAGFFKRLVLRLLNQDKDVPHPLGLSLEGHDLIRPWCPPYYGSMEEAVHAFVRFKRDSVVQAELSSAFPRAWKDPRGVQGKIPGFSDACVDATAAYCTYIYETYGRFPAYFGPLRTTLAHQAHHLELDFYDRFYSPGAYTETQARHMAN